MLWTDLAGPLAKAGGKILGRLLAGPAGAAIGGRVGDLVADALGTAPTPEAVAETVQADPARAREVLAQVEQQYGPELIAYAGAQLAFATELMRAEKAEGWTSYGWRRLAGWSIPVLGLWQLLVGPVLTALTGATLTTDFAAFVAYAGIVATYLMGGHTLKEVMGSRK